ncbi:MAG: 4-alpha-glucanotransferase [Candidatus Sumerlaeota bacterium]|nr:4-alpha-glucanotransferase [Candidatus Sumerlaeota bacterium]
MAQESKSCRQAGILLHPTSLPGRSGIGDIGRPAYEFVKFLIEGAQSLWQLCPLGPTGYGDSPYASLSAFAGNPLLIGLEPLADDGLADASEIDAFPAFPADHVDYVNVTPAKMAFLMRVGQRFPERANAGLKSEFDAFCERNRGWLDDYALYVTLKQSHGGVAWTQWPASLARREPAAMKEARQRHAAQIAACKVIQFLFFRQWASLRRFANERQIRLIGDVPIFVAQDSADVWANPHLFFLKDDGEPTVVSGVPPDYFSPSGQRWGNPIFRWKEMRKDGYAWWIARMKAVLELVDIVRIDHFRGFEAYWEVRAEAPNALNGRWVKGPGADFFLKLRDALGSLPLIAEDLGIITPKVHALREQFGLPGMKILQFAFGDDARNPYLLHNIEANSVVYTGTHDNDTTLGWYRGADEAVKDKARRYLWCDGANIHLDLTRTAYMSRARMAIIPLQDVLGFGGEARMNVPGAAEGNWKWRVTPDHLNPGKAGALRYLTELYGRNEHPQPAAPANAEARDPRFDPDHAAEAG